MRQPLAVSEVIEFTNSLVKDTKYEEIIKNFKEITYHNLPEDKLGEIGYGWWKGFRRRYHDLLVTKRGVKFAVDRSEWSTEHWIRQMYDEVYKNMVNAGIAKKVDEPVYFDINGVVVDDQQKAFGLPCEYVVTHPDHLIFFDETGCNTNQKKDGHKGGQKFVCGRGMTPKIISATRDKHFTVLGLTAGTGEPVLCVVVFASEKKHGVVADWAEGIDITVKPVTDENGENILDEVNFGNGKYMPSGPTCFFRGKQ